MGAEPGEAYLVLGLPRGFTEAQALELVRGAQELAQATGSNPRGGCGPRTGADDLGHGGRLG